MNSSTVIPLGPCEEFAFDIGDLVDGTLAPERVAALQLHVGVCARCRQWHAALLQVDAALAAGLPRPALSAQFATHLQGRIAGLVEEQRRLRNSDALDAAAREYERMTASLRGWRWPGVLNGVATASMVGAAFFALQTYAPALAQATTAGDPATLLKILSMGAGVGFAVIVATRTRRFGLAALQSSG